MNREFSISSRRVITRASQPPRAATLRIRDGKVAAIEEGFSADAIDCGNSVIMPGIVDTHAHINEPGRTEWEGFETATQAAAAGGITTVIDMPLNSIPATTSLAALQIKLDATTSKCWIDFGFWGGVVPGNFEELQPMIDAGVMGFKAFLIESGVDEFKMAREEDLRRAMPLLAKAGVPLIAHAELESKVPNSKHAAASYQRYLDSRPASWELDAIRMLITLARETGCKTHIVHLSASEALTEITEAKAAGVPITVETCPHYLSFAAEEIPEGATQYKCAPPIRSRSNREKLWEGIKKGQIDFVVSDHSPCTPKLKQLETGSFEAAWGGISGIQFSMPVVWSEMSRRGLGVQDLVRLMSERTAAFVGLGARKGALEIGYDADLVVWNPERSFYLDRSLVKHRHSLTPYEGRELSGVIERTYVGGQLAFESGHKTPPATGRFLARPGAKKALTQKAGI